MNSLKGTNRLPHPLFEMIKFTIAIRDYIKQKAVSVNECNKRFWQMPFACSSTRISDDLRVSRQTVITARKHLVKRRLISFT